MQPERRIKCADRTGANCHESMTAGYLLERHDVKNRQ